MYKTDHKINNKGEKNPNVKLTDQQVNEIKLLRYKLKYSYRTLAATYGCSHTQVKRIIKQESRTDV
jgi:DNA invertase Pin-like site-specific DNA recombinase